MPGTNADSSNNKNKDNTIVSGNEPGIHEPPDFDSSEDISPRYIIGNGERFSYNPSMDYLSTHGNSHVIRAVSDRPGNPVFAIKAHRKDPNNVWLKDYLSAELVTSSFLVGRHLDRLASVQCEVAVHERLLLAKRKHPFVAPIRAIFEDEKHIYVAMDLYPCSLQDRLQWLGRRNEIMISSEIQHHTAEILLAMQFLEHYGIFHCDIKPANVMIQSSGHVALIDFDLAAVSSSGAGSGYRGTPRFVAPEVLSQNKRIDKFNAKTSDLYSLGITLWIMLSCPVAREYDEEYPWIAAAANLHPGSLGWKLCEELTKKNPSNRPPMGLIEMHPFFHRIDFDRLRLVPDSLPPVFIPGAPLHTESTTQKTSSSDIENSWVSRICHSTQALTTDKDAPTTGPVSRTTSSAAPKPILPPRAPPLWEEGELERICTQNPKTRLNSILLNNVPDVLEEAILAAIAAVKEGWEYVMKSIWPNDVPRPPTWMTLIVLAYISLLLAHNLNLAWRYLGHLRVKARLGFRGRLIRSVLRLCS